MDIDIDMDIDTSVVRTAVAHLPTVSTRSVSTATYCIYTPLTPRIRYDAVYTALRSSQVDTFERSTQPSAVDIKSTTVRVRTLHVQ